MHTPIPSTFLLRPNHAVGKATIYYTNYGNWRVYGLHRPTGLNWYGFVDVGSPRAAWNTLWKMRLAGNIVDPRLFTALERYMEEPDDAQCP